MKKAVIAGAIGVLLVGAGVGAAIGLQRGGANNDATDTSRTTALPDATPDKPYANKNFYVDKSRTIVTLADTLEKQGNAADAAVIRRVAEQPGTTWLIGPTASDATAERDIREVTRTSGEAAQQGTLPVYQLYAIPLRDACAPYSKGGFATGAEYLAWINRIVGALKTPAVFSVEADAIGQMAEMRCLNESQMAERQTTLEQAIATLQQSEKVAGVYLDAAHSEWFADPAKLVPYLKQSGIDNADGIAVNVSYFVAMPDILEWSNKLLRLIGEDKGVMIDTSRNGRGVAPPNANVEARWCNPPGRGTGPVPTTRPAEVHVHAYFWGKIIGESDGSCNGQPAAGTFVPAIALELARNGIQ